MRLNADMASVRDLCSKLVSMTKEWIYFDRVYCVKGIVKRFSVLGFTAHK